MISTCKKANFTRDTCVKDSLGLDIGIFSAVKHTTRCFVCDGSLTSPHGTIHNAAKCILIETLHLQLCVNTSNLQQETDGEGFYIEINNTNKCRLSFVCLNLFYLHTQS